MEHDTRCRCEQGQEETCTQEMLENIHRHTHTYALLRTCPTIFRETERMNRGSEVILHLVSLCGQDGGGRSGDRFFHSGSVGKPQRPDYHYLTNRAGGSLGEGEEGCSNHLVKSLLHLICHAKGVIASLDKWLLFLK